MGSKTKKKLKICQVPAWHWAKTVFTECWARGTRQRIFFKKIKTSLPRARIWAFGKGPKPKNQGRPKIPIFFPPARARARFFTPAAAHLAARPPRRWPPRLRAAPRLAAPPPTSAPTGGRPAPHAGPPLPPSHHRRRPPVAAPGRPGSTGGRPAPGRPSSPRAGHHRRPPAPGRPGSTGGRPIVL